MFGNGQQFFWSDAAKRLYRARNALDYLSQFDSQTREASLKEGIFPKHASDDPNTPANELPVDAIAEYRFVAESCDRARTSLIAIASGDKPSAKGESEVKLGEVYLDEKAYVLNHAWCHKNLRVWSFADFIHKAAKDNDVSFFKKLGKALSSREKRSPLDWTRCDELDCFLVDFWCGQPFGFPKFPPLCFLTDTALADCCAHALGRDTLDKTVSFDAVRKRRQRLKLKQAKNLRIKNVKLTGQEIVFE